MVEYWLFYGNVIDNELLKTPMIM